MNYQKKSKKELLIELLKTKQELVSYKESARIEKPDVKQLVFDLGERIKELNCHNSMTQLFLKKNISMEEVMEELVQLIPVAWQFPELAEAVVKVRNKTYKTKGYRKTEVFQGREICVSSEVIGYIEVCYPVRSLPPAEHIFLKEEFDLLSSIAERTGDYIEIAEKSFALLASEKRLRNIVENINDIIYEYDEKGIITYISPVIEKTYGFHPEELIGKGISNFVGGGADFTQKRINELREKGEIQTDYEIKSRSGEVLWASLSTKAVFEGDRFVGGAGIMTDVHQRKLAEGKLRQSEEKYRALFYESPDAYLIVVDGVFVECNRASEVLIRGMKSDIIGKTPPMISPEFQPNGKKSSDYVNDVITKAFEDGTHSFEWKHTRTDGSDFLAYIHLSAIDYEGKDALLVTWSDITKTRESELRIRQLSRAVEQSPMSVVITDINGNIEYANPKAIETTGYSLEELIGRNPRVLQSGDTKKTDYEKLWATIGKGKEWQGIFHNKKKSGELYWESSTIAPVTDESGKIVNYIAIKEDITERRFAEEEIRKFKTIVDQANFGNVLSDLDGVLLYSNDAFAKMHGMEVNEILGKHLSILHNEKQMIRVAETIDLLKVNGEFNAEEVWRTRKDGSVFPSLMNAKILVDSNNVPQFMTATVLDISIIKNAESAIRLSEENLNYAQEIAGMGNWQLDIATGKTTWSENLYKIYGLQPFKESIPDNYFLKIIHPDDLHLVDEKQREIIETRKSTSVDLRLIMPDGKIKWIQNNIVPDFDGETLTRLRGVNIDITDRKQSEAEIKKLSLAVNQSPVCVVITDLYGNIEYVNPAFKVATGYDPEEVIGKNTRILKSGKNDENMYNDLWKTITAGRVWKKEWINKKKNGEFYWENISITPIHDESGKIMNFLAIKQDISDRKKNEQEILDLNLNLEVRILERTSELAVTNTKLVREIDDRRRAEEELLSARYEAEKANRAKSEFLANMSHEIRTPMNAILGYSELLGNLVLDKTQKDFLNSIKASGRSLLTLINDILDLSKIEAGKLELEFDYYETALFFTEFERIFSFKLTEKRLRFFTDITSGTPAFLYLDGPRLRQVILNIVGNAVKFTQKGSIGIKIMSENPRIVNYTDTRYEEYIDLIIEISDTGMGIPKEFLNDIFESFIQVKSRSNKGGTGLGLAITSRLVQLMNGTISVQSELGEGSTFIVKIPDIPFLRSYESMKSAAEVNPADIIFGDATILVVDDVEENRKFIKDTLRDRDFILLEAANGISALELMNKTIPDLIISDIRMPGMDGFELLAAIKSSEALKHIPVIAYSASVMKEQKEKIHKSEFADLLIKPVKVSELYLSLMKSLPHELRTGQNSEKSETVGIEDEGITEYEELMSELLGNYSRICETFKARQPLGEIKNFGRDLIDLGRKHLCSKILRYGEEVIIAAESFNIEGLLRLIKQYKEVVESIRK